MKGAIRLSQLRRPQKQHFPQCLLRNGRFQPLDSTAQAPQQQHFAKRLPLRLWFPEIEMRSMPTADPNCPNYLRAAFSMMALFTIVLNRNLRRVVNSNRQRPNRLGDYRHVALPFCNRLFRPVGE